jgi:hypothetical protein
VVDNAIRYKRPDEYQTENSLNRNQQQKEAQKQKEDHQQVVPIEKNSGNANEEKTWVKQEPVSLPLSVIQKDQGSKKQFSEKVPTPQSSNDKKDEKPEPSINSNKYTTTGKRIK